MRSFLFLQSVYSSEYDIWQRCSTGLLAIWQLEFDSLFDPCCITYSTDPVELREWLLLYNVQHQSFWFMQMEMSVAQRWSASHLTIENWQSMLFKFDLWCISYSIDHVELNGSCCIKYSASHRSSCKNRQQHPVVNVYSGQLKQSLRVKFDRL